MEAPIANTETGKVVFPKAGAKEKGAAPEAVTYVNIPKSVMDNLSDLAIRDGFEADAETDKGVQQQTTRACRAYILMAVDRLLADRATVEED